MGAYKVGDGKMLGGQNAVKSTEAEPALAVEEVGDMRLAKAGVAGESEGGQVSMADTFQEKSANALLQRMECHGKIPELV
jgi:hypothetical protein